MTRTRFYCYVLRCPNTLQFWRTGTRDQAQQGWHADLPLATTFFTRAEAIRAIRSVPIDAISRRQLEVVGLTTLPRAT